MQESGKLAQLKIKWWKEKRGGGACQVKIRMKTKHINLKNNLKTFTRRLWLFLKKKTNTFYQFKHYLNI